MEYNKWLAAGNIPDPLIPPPTPTLDDIYDAVFQNERVLKALIISLNDGSFVIGGNRTANQIKTLLKSKM